MKKLSILLCSMLLVSGVFAQWPANVGPDPYGYTMRNFDSNDIEYAWVDITSIGTQVSGLGDDNFVGPFDIGFNFQFYWLGRNEVYIGSNGYISFNTGFNYASQGGGFSTIPNNADQKNEMIAPLLSDLSFATPVPGSPNPGECYFYTNGTDLAIISFINVPFWSSTDPGEWSGANTFQVQLNGVDSTVKIIYLQQDGSYDAAYAPASNTMGLDPGPVVIGIENVSGTIGVGLNSVVNANDLLPTAMTGSLYSPPRVPGISVPDLEVFEIQNKESAGFFLPVPGSDFFVGAQLTNVGNTDIVSRTVIDAEVVDGTGATQYVDQFVVDSVKQGASAPVQFAVPLILPQPGSYAFDVDLTNNDDINFSNNSKTVEVNALDTVGGKARFAYTVLNDARGVDAGVLWTGGSGNSGAAVYIEPYGYPTTFESAEFFMTPVLFDDGAGGVLNADTIPDGGYRVTVYRSDPSGAIPGSLQVLDTTIFKADVNLTQVVDPATNNVFFGGWNRVDFPDPVQVDSGGLYVAWYHLNDSLRLAGETAAPISRRSFEILSGTWAPHRSRNTEDFAIRLIADVSDVVFDTTGVSIDPKTSDIVKFDAYPNPTEGIVNLDVNLEKATTATVRVLNMNGSKVHLSFHRGVSAINETIDLRRFAKGMYLIQVETELGVMTKKIAVQ